MSPTKTARVVETENGQAVHLPDDVRFETSTVSVRREGEAVILEPIKSSGWPAGFFAAIRIDDPAFERPPQGTLPPVPSFD
jgi:antitoxin VapB